MTLRGSLTARVLTPTLIVLMVFAALVGPRGVDSTLLLRDLWGQGLSGWGWLVLLQLRLPRVLIAASTGAALSMAGAALQTWLRNPIADAGILGISAWGALGAVFALYLGLSAVTPWAQPVMAAAAALLALSVLLFARQRAESPERLLMLGVGLGGIGASLISLVLSWSLPDWKASRQIIAWLLGGLDGRTWVHAAAALPLAIAGMALLLAEHDGLDALRLGPLEAASLGVDVPRLEWRLVVGTGLLAGAAAAGAGAIGFVGIIVPYLVRSTSFARHRLWLIHSGLAGAAFLVLADLIARRAPGAGEIQLGVLTGLLGAPILLRQLLIRQEHAQ
jgi:iron complex transport system permease protein